MRVTETSDVAGDNLFFTAIAFLMDGKAHYCFISQLPNKILNKQNELLGSHLS